MSSAWFFILLFSSVLWPTPVFCAHFLSYEFYKANDFPGCTDASTTEEFNAFAAAHPDLWGVFQRHALGATAW